MHNFDINIKNLSKVEGHASLDIKVEKDEVRYVKLRITENQRFFEQAVRGKPIVTAPQLMSRICGTCSIAHMMCCIEAIEKTIGVQPTEQTAVLKKLSMYSLMIRDHALHLYFFMLPDVIGKDSILDFDMNNAGERKMLQDAFAIKAAGNNLSNLIAGRSVHAPYPTVGGFLHQPDENGIKKSVTELRAVRQRVIDLIGTFHEWSESFKRETDHVALKTKDFSFLEGEITSTRGLCIREADYMEHLIKIIIPYSQASGFEFEGEEFMVGALSRMSLNTDALHPQTRQDAKESLKIFPSSDIFKNNVAQAVEILHSIDHSLELLENSKFVKEPLPEIKPKEGTGIGVVEAPRGTLYYKVNVGKTGTIRNATVVVPTAQNQINMERDIAKLVQDNISVEKNKIEYEIEKLLRAYDPCMSCASHFLRVNWM